MLSQEEMDRLRREFARRLDSLIGDAQNEKNLENFARKTGISMRQLSQWRSPRHVNWPNAANLIRISRGASVSIDWLLTGRRHLTNGRERRIERVG
jgi:transcriptional regulator with XRE-family HTH domain